MNDYTGMSTRSALIYLAVLIVTPLFLPLAVVILATCWRFLVRSSLESDRRILEVLWRRTKPVLAIWATGLVLAFLVNITTGLLGPALEHIAAGK